MGVNSSNIPFNKPSLGENELVYIREVLEQGRVAGDGQFTKRCQVWLEKNIGCIKALLTHSCTAALEMAAILLDVQQGDEIIMPSFTFVSTANAFVLRGGVPVFVDIRPDTLNIDENLIEQAITSKTKAIVVVHYAGVSCEMDTILAIAKRYSLPVVEDAAQGLMSSYKGRALGSMGDLGCLSFHETKNVVSGEGGALLVNNSRLVKRSEVIREKGTDRSQFIRGEVDKYTWQDIGSSFLPGELIAACLYAQLERSVEITQKRYRIFTQYRELLGSLELIAEISLPSLPKDCIINGHIFFFISRNKNRDDLLSFLKSIGINSTFHYVPLHLAPAGRRYGREGSSLVNTEALASKIVRLPIWVGMEFDDVSRIANAVQKYYQS